MTDTPNPLGVALIGAGADHWSGIAHIPAIRANDQLKLRWLVTSNPTSAREAQRRWQVPATHNLRHVLDDDTVDLVVITLRVTRHAEIATAAIKAGKHVYCEWPLAIHREQAHELATLSAAHSDRVHMTGLQGRYSPELQEAADLIAAGRIGRLLTANLRLWVPLGLVPRAAHRAHLRHRSTAANVLTIQAGHALDMTGRILGDARVTASRLWCAVDEFIVQETGERLPRDAPDNLAALLSYQGGVVVVAQASQTSAETAFYLEFLGAEGVIRLTGRGQPESTRLTLSITDLGGAERTVTPAAPVLPGLSRQAPGYNVALAYAALAAAVRTQHRDPWLPDFAAAVGLHDLLASVSAKAETGARAG